MKQIIKTMLLTMAFAILLGTSGIAAESPAAAIGKKNYTTLESALAAVKKGQTIKLKKSVTIDHALELNRNTKYTLDLNGKTLSLSGTSEGNVLVKKGTVTVQGGKLNGSILVEKGARLDIRSGTYQQIVNSGTTNIYNAKITAKNMPALICKGGKMTVKKGTFRSNAYCLYLKGGSAQISGGSFRYYDTNNKSILLGVEKGTLEIAGGSFQNNNCVLYNLGGKVSIKKGTLSSGKILSVINEAALTISGGTIKCTGSAVGECALFCRKGSSTQMKKGTVTGKKTAVILEAGVGKFRLSGGKISNNSRSYPPVLVNEKKSSRVSVKTGNISTKCELKIYYEG